MRQRQTYKSPKVIPNFRDIGVQTDRTGVRIKRVTVLINLVIEDANRAPESGITSISVDCLLIGLIGLGILLLRHVTSTEKIPALCIGVVCIPLNPTVNVQCINQDSPELTDFSRYSMACS